MHSERGLQRVVGSIVLVLAFSLLGTIAILVLGNDHERTGVASNQFGLVVNGTYYILDTNAELIGDQTDGRIHIFHSATPNVPRVSSSMTLTYSPNYVSSS